MDVFKDIPPTVALRLAQCSRAMYDLREARKQLLAGVDMTGNPLDEQARGKNHLAQSGLATSAAPMGSEASNPAAPADAAALLVALRAGRVAEHPAYEIALGAQLMHRQEDVLRAQLAAYCQPHAMSADLPLSSPHRTVDPTVNRLSAPPAYENTHPLASLFDAIAIPDRFLAQPIAFYPDAVALNDGEACTVRLRIVSPQDWSFDWQQARQGWRLDTAPVPHAGVGTPAHLHCPDGTVADDPFGLHTAREMTGVIQIFLHALARLLAG